MRVWWTENLLSKFWRSEIVVHLQTPLPTRAPPPPDAPPPQGYSETHSLSLVPLSLCLIIAKHEKEVASLFKEVASLLEGLQVRRLRRRTCER